MKKNTAPSEREVLIEEIRIARNELQRARDNFNNCEPSFFEIANAELTVCKTNLDLLIKKSRMLTKDW